LYDLALYLLGPRADRLSPPAEAALLQAIFHTDQIGAFAGHWAKAPAEIKQQPDLQLLWAAYQAGWGTGEQQTAGEQALLAALDRPEQQELAGHLLLVARAQAGKTEAYAQVLKQREQSGTDRLVEHLIYWRLLDRAGRRADAQALALACDRQPAMTFDLLRLGQVLVGLGLVDRAITCLQDRVLAHDSAEELWALYTDLLIGNQRWHDLRAVALRLREGTGVGGALEGFSYYLEGRAELGLERLASARAAFGRLADSAIPSPSLAWRTGQALIELDQWQAAKTLLVQAEPAMENNLTFYSALFTVGQRLRDPGLLLRAAERAYRLDPANPTLAGNYATALLVNRQAPAEAIRLTLLAYNQDPEGPGPCLNHALALLQNQRLEEAGRLLATIRTHEFTPDGLACYYATCAEVFLSLGQSQRAREMLEQVEPAHLFPAQARWIAEARESIVALKASAQASPTTLKAN
jgi:tetratricopeptide (TPR) repeat protein